MSASPIARRRCRAALKWVAALGLASSLADCVTLELHAQDGETQVVRHLGVLQVTLAKPARTSITGSVSGVGLVSAPLGTTLGYTRQRWVLLGTDCRTVVWSPDAGFDEGTRASLARAAGVCLTSTDSHPAAGSAASSGDVP